MKLSRVQAAAVLLGVQLLLVLSIAAKYLYERHARPRVWVRAVQYDPDQPLRGRYLALQLLVDACALPKDKPTLEYFNNGGGAGAGIDARSWRAADGVRDGKLVVYADAQPRTPEETHDVVLPRNASCERALLRDEVEYFVPEHAKGPFPLKPAQELWVEVTVPELGPPRPIQLALSDQSGFRVLKLE